MMNRNKISLQRLTYFAGHGSTNTTKWLEATEPYYVRKTNFLIVVIIKM